MSDNPNLVLAYHTLTREKVEVPAYWLDDEVSPFPGQWRAAPSTIEELGTETGSLSEEDPAESPEIPDENVAGDISDANQTPAAKGQRTKADTAKSK